MNTIKVRKEHPELMKRIGKSMENIRLSRDFDFQGGNSIRSSFCSSKNDFFSKFLGKSLLEDIEELHKIIGEEEHEK